jgi:hypothetical protein
VQLGQRIAVVGTSGAGKTTLSARLAEVLDCPHIELDAFQHGPNWQPATVEELRERTDRVTAGERWVSDGNYEAVRDLTWGRADQLVWLDYERPLIMFRVIRRSVWRAITRKPMWNENREARRAAAQLPGAAPPARIFPPRRGAPPSSAGDAPPACRGRWGGLSGAISSRRRRPRRAAASAR